MKENKNNSTSSPGGNKYARDTARQKLFAVACERFPSFPTVRTASGKVCESSFYMSDAWATALHARLETAVREKMNDEELVRKMRKQILETRKMKTLETQIRMLHPRKPATDLEEVMESQGRAGGVEVVEPSDEGGRDPHPHVHAKKSARTTSASYQAAEHNAKAIIVYNLCSAISIGTALGPFFEKYVLQVQQELGSRLLVFWPVGLIVDRQPERRHELARAVGTIGLGAVALLGSALYSDYLPFIYVAMVVLGVFYEGLTSSSETLFADSVQELANEADSADAKAQISANWFTKKMAASYSGVALSPLLGVLCVLYFRRYVSPHVLLTRDQFAHEIGVPAVPDADSAEAATVNVYWNMGLLHFILLLGLILILPAVWRISGLKSIGRIKNKPASPSSGGALLSQDLSEPLVSKVPSPTTPGTTTTTSSSKVPYVIAVADFAQCIGAGMTFKYFNLFFIQDFGFGPTEICALQIVYPLCMVITVEFCNRVFLPLLKNSRAKVSMLCRLIAVLGLWLIGGAYPFQMVERDGSGSITSASSAEEASTTGAQRFERG
eukprot:g4311.t1